MRGYTPLRYVFFEGTYTVWNISFFKEASKEQRLVKWALSVGDEEGRRGGQKYDGANEGRKRRTCYEQKSLRGSSVLLSSDSHKDLSGTSTKSLYCIFILFLSTPGSNFHVTSR